jgi:hypothetical protein
LDLSFNGYFFDSNKNDLAQFFSNGPGGRTDFCHIYY